MDTTNLNTTSIWRHRWVHAWGIAAALTMYIQKKSCSFTYIAKGNSLSCYAILNLLYNCVAIHASLKVTKEKRLQTAKWVTVNFSQQRYATAAACIDHMVFQGQQKGLNCYGFGRTSFSQVKNGLPFYNSKY